MTYQVVHKELVREFDFFPPFAWQYWHQRAFDEDGRNGLPLIVALHGGGQDPLGLQADWNFPLLANVDDESNWQDRCLVLYPYGNAYLHVDGAPLRGWNPGFTGEFLSSHSDVGFIRAAIAEVERLLQRDLNEAGIDRPAIDRDRCFVFGYSAGGMMAYKLAREMPNTFAALWVMSGAYGARSHEGLTRTVTNNPQGSHGVSLFAHHGDDDTVVPPGDRQDASGHAVPTFANSLDLYDLTGVPSADAGIYKPGYRTLAAAIDTYVLFNNCEQNPADIERPTAMDPNAGASDIGGNSSSTKVTFRQAANVLNPEVIVHRDPLMQHANFVSSGNRYYDATEVLEFFKAHPRVPL